MHEAQLSKSTVAAEMHLGSGLVCDLYPVHHILGQQLRFKVLEADLLCIRACKVAHEHGNGNNANTGNDVPR